MPYKDLEQRKKYMKEYSKKWVKENPEKTNVATQKWRNSEKGKIWVQKYYQNKDFKAKRRRFINERNQKLKQWAIDKLGNKCMKCGLPFDTCIYDFHHIKIDGKKWNQSSSIRMLIIYQWKKADKIPEGIMLLCANCHRLIHKQLLLLLS